MGEVVVTPARCLWCHHELRWHHGAPQATKDRFKAQGHNVKWQSTACSKLDCAGCRKWEAP